MRICLQMYDRLPGGEGGNSISLLHPLWPQQSSECVASTIAPCYAVTPPDTSSAGQYNVTWGHIMKKKKIILFPFLLLPTGINWIQTADLVYTWGCNECRKKKRGKEGGTDWWMDSQRRWRTVMGWWKKDRSFQAAWIYTNLHWCDQIFAPCLYVLFECSCLGNAKTGKNAGK